METALPRPVSSVLDSFDELAVEDHEKWFDLAYRFLEWERANIQKDDPNEATRKSHRKALIYLLKMTETMAALAPDDEKLETLRWRLNESWERFCNRPSREKVTEMEALLSKVFPG